MFVSVDLIYLAHERDQWQAVTSKLLNRRFQLKWEICLLSEHSFSS
jgi:hypothetical protein